MSNDELIIDNVLIAFVDTSAIDPMYNDYRNMEHQFAALKKHIESNKLTILTHEIAVKEMENHITALRTARKQIGLLWNDCDRMSGDYAILSLFLICIIEK